MCDDARGWRAEFRTTRRRMSSEMQGTRLSVADRWGEEIKRVRSRCPSLFLPLFLRFRSGPTSGRNVLRLQTGDGDVLRRGLWTLENTQLASRTSPSPVSSRPVMVRPKPDTYVPGDLVETQSRRVEGSGNSLSGPQRAGPVVSAAHGQAVRAAHQLSRRGQRAVFVIRGACVRIARAAQARFREPAR
jgi:hypothetical protein